MSLRHTITLTLTLFSVSVSLCYYFYCYCSCLPPPSFIRPLRYATLLHCICCGLMILDGSDIMFHVCVAVICDRWDGSVRWIGSEDDPSEYDSMRKSRRCAVQSCCGWLNFEVDMDELRCLSRRRRSFHTSALSSSLSISSVSVSVSVSVSISVSVSAYFSIKADYYYPPPNLLLLFLVAVVVVFHTTLSERFILFITINISFITLFRIFSCCWWSS